MKKTVIVVWASFCFLTAPAGVAADADFVLEINPLAYLVSPDIEDFRASNGLFLEEISGFGSLLPSLKAGVGFESGTVILDLLGGFGYLWNDAFSATCYSGDAFLRFKLGRQGNVTLGPHLGVVRFEPDYDGIAQVDLGTETGWVAGLGFTAGSSRVAFAMTLDYLSAAFDAAGSGGWTTNQNELDISGFQVVLGVQFRF